MHWVLIAALIVATKPSVFGLPNPRFRLFCCSCGTGDRLLVDLLKKNESNLGTKLGNWILWFWCQELLHTCHLDRTFTRCSAWVWQWENHTWGDSPLQLTCVTMLKNDKQQWVVNQVVSVLQQRKEPTCRPLFSDFSTLMLTDPGPSGHAGTRAWHSLVLILFAMLYCLYYLIDRFDFEP